MRINPGDETFEVEFAFGAPSVRDASSVGAFDSGGAKATVTIKANDPRVVALPKVRFGSTGYHAIEGGAEATIAVSMYPRPITQVDIPLTVTNLDSTTNADYEIFVNGSLVSPDSLSLTFSPDDRDSGGGGIAQRFTVKAVANDHRESVKFGFGTVPSDVLIEGETDGRAAKTATVWLLEPQTEMMACRTPDTSAPNNSASSATPTTRGG